MPDDDEDPPVSRSVYDELAPGYADVTDAAILERFADDGSVEAIPAQRAERATDDETERVDRDWGDEDPPFVVPFYRRPPQAVSEPATGAGLPVERAREPGVTDAFVALAPDHAAAFRDGPPNFRCLRLPKPA